jgi:peptidyl-prolyl cis-trans isomerase D
LKPVADKLGLKIETITGLTRKPSTAYPKTSAYNQPKFLSAIFSDEATKNKRNTEAIEVGPRFLIAGHVIEYKPVTHSPLAQVRQQVEESIMLLETEKLALKSGEAKLAELRNGGTAEFSAAKPISRNNNSSTPPPAVYAIMKADINKLPAYVGVNLGGMGYRIFRINKIVEQPADEANAKSEEQQVNEFLAAQEMAAYLGVIKKRANAEILKPAAVAKAKSATASVKQ